METREERRMTDRELEERINELEEALDSHGRCDCDLCLQRGADLVGLREEKASRLKDYPTKDHIGFYTQPGAHAKRGS